MNISPSSYRLCTVSAIEFRGSKNWGGGGRLRVAYVFVVAPDFSVLGRRLKFRICTYIMQFKLYSSRHHTSIFSSSSQ